MPGPLATPCWIWQRSLGSHGYGQMRHEGTTRLAHRVAYAERHGAVPPQLDHLCRDRRCVNPDHLEPCTTAENTQRGSAAKLTPEAIREIRALREGGQRLRVIAETFGITNQAVSDIVLRKRWANV